MRIIATADYQGMANQIDPKLIPDGDVLLCAGDITTWGRIEELEEFNKWIGLLPHKYKLVIFGNHDFEIQDDAIDIKRNILSNCIYLENELFAIKGLRIWGSPISENSPFEVPYYFRAFSENQKEACDIIPEGLDILITHGPPYMILDRLTDGRHVGSKFIANAVEQVKPKYHVFGHIHSQHGVSEKENTTFINAALCNDRNVLFKKSKLFFDPVVIDL